jgi:hypothetical protein
VIAIEYDPGVGVAFGDPLVAAPAPDAAVAGRRVASTRVAVGPALVAAPVGVGGTTVGRGVAVAAGVGAAGGVGARLISHTASTNATTAAATAASRLRADIQRYSRAQGSAARGPDHGASATTRTR